MTLNLDRMVSNWYDLQANSFLGGTSYPERTQLNLEVI
jgi:hypothetical protein